MSYLLRSIIYRATTLVHKDAVIDTAMISLFGLVSITWFRGDFFIWTGDFAFIPYQIQPFSQPLYSWGTFNSAVRTISALIPYELFRVLSGGLGLSGVIAEMIWFYINLTLSGFSMYYLISVLGQKRKIRLIPAIFYMYIPNISNVNFLLLTPTAFPHYASLPLLLALFVRGIDQRKGVKYGFFLGAIWTFVSTSAYINPVYVVISWYVIISYLVSYIIINRADRSKITAAIQFTMSLVLIWMALNLYWILPLAFSFSSELHKTIYLYQRAGESSLDRFMASSASLFDVFRLAGFWALSSGYKGEFYAPWAQIYSSSILFLAISFTFPILAVIPILNRSKKKHILYFASLLITGAFFAKGPNAPFGETITWLFVNVTILQSFRNIYSLFFPVITLCYAFLIGEALSSIHSFRIPRIHMKSLGPILTIAISFMLLGVYMFPVWSGEVIHSGGNIIPSARVKIPEYYYEARSWLSEDRQDFTIFSLPMSKAIGYEAFSWEHGYAGGGVTGSLIQRPVISDGSIYEGLPGLVAQRIVENSTTNASKILVLMNVKYLIFHRDAAWQFIDGSLYGGFIFAAPEHLQSILSSQQGLHVERTFEKLDFYKNEYWTPVHIYAASNAIPVRGGLNEMVDIVESNNFTPNNFVLFLSDQLTHEQYSFITELDNYYLKPDITYEKMNPTKYVVNVNASYPFFLVFSGSYHKDWIAYVDGREVELHLMANGYANAWYINKTGTFKIVLDFWPQKLFYIGSAISLTTFILSVLYFSKNRIKTFHRQHIMKKE